MGFSSISSSFIHFKSTEKVYVTKMFINQWKKLPVSFKDICGKRIKNIDCGSFILFYSNGKNPYSSHILYASVWGLKFDHGIVFCNKCSIKHSSCLSSTTGFNFITDENNEKCACMASLQVLILVFHFTLFILFL